MIITWTTGSGRILLLIHSFLGRTESRPAQKEDTFRKENLLKCPWQPIFRFRHFSLRAHCFLQQYLAMELAFILLSRDPDQTRNADTHSSAFLLSGFRKNSRCQGRCSYLHPLSLTLRPPTHWKS